jgi:hypothetical protein
MSSTSQTRESPDIEAYLDIWVSPDSEGYPDIGVFLDIEGYPDTGGKFDIRETPLHGCVVYVFVVLTAWLC